MKIELFSNRTAWLAFGLFALVTAYIYSLGLHGPFIFDDFPNIVDNAGVQPTDASLANLLRSALSSPSSEFKRPLASLSFAANFLATGMDPFPMKVTNLTIHLLNGLFVFLFARLALKHVTTTLPENSNQAFVAALIAGLWLLLPINLTAVLYVVQRMESMANLFVMAGLVWYTSARARMQTSRHKADYVSAVAAILVCTSLGGMVKETAVLLPLYAAITDAALFGWKSLSTSEGAPRLDRRIQALFLLVLFIPMFLGLGWLLPSLLRERAWSTRDFSLRTRLLTELRVVTAYVNWTIAPTPKSLSFYHDDWTISQNWLRPLTTLFSGIFLAALAALAVAVRHRYRVVTLGIALFLAGQLLTGTILPLELVYEHRNYFSSFGLLLAVVPILTTTRLPARLPRAVLLVALTIQCVVVLSTTTLSWNSPLLLARELADRAPTSPRAQYELGRTYVILSRYEPESPFTPLVYSALERAMKLPDSSILAEQALIFFNARLHRPILDIWWASMTRKLATRKVTVQDESALGALTQCSLQELCALSTQRMLDAYGAALSHPSPSARLLAMYGDFAWNGLKDQSLGLRATLDAVKSSPSEAAYRITAIRMLYKVGRIQEANAQRDALARLNVGGALDSDLANIDILLKP